MIFSKASGVNDSLFGKSQEPIAAFISGREEAFEKNSQLKSIFKMDPIKGFAAKYTGMTSLGNFEPVGENGDYPENDFQEGYSRVIEADTWKDRFSLTKEMEEDGVLLDEAMRRAGSFTLAYNRTRETFGAEVLRNSIATTMTFGKKNKVFNIAGADGKSLFATDHPSKTGGTAAQSNQYNAEFSYDNLSKLEEKMQKFKDDEGNLLNIRPNTIIIPNNATIKQTVFQVLNADGIPGNGNNDGNFHLGRWNVIVWNYLSNPTGITSGKDWWVLCDSDWNEIYGGLIFVDRIKLTVRSFIDENTDANVWNGRARFSAGANDWRAFLGATPGLGSTLS